MAEVVDSPGGQELAEGHRAESRVRAAKAHLFGGEAEAAQVGEVLLPQPAEAREEARHTLVAIGPKAFPIEGGEGPGFAVLKDDADAGHPVRLLAEDEVAEDVFRAVGLRTFVRGGEV